MRDRSGRERTISRETEVGETEGERDRGMVGERKIEREG